MTDPIVLVRIRNQIIAYLELAASFQEQMAYQTSAPHICVPSEVINQWEDWVQPDWREYMTSPLFSREEIEAIGDYHDVWDSVASETPDPLLGLEHLFGTPEWQQLASASATALSVFQVRGRFSDIPDEA